MLESFSFATFSELVDDDFRIRLDDGSSVDLRLAAASRSALPAQPGGREPFSLLFRGPAPILPQRIYSVEHPGLGAFDLFLVALTPDEDGARYEAVFA